MSTQSQFDGSNFQVNLKNPQTWKRLFFMLIFALIVSLVRMLLWAVVIFQIISALITGQPNRHLLQLGKALSEYLYDILLFLTFSSDIPPFPLSDWSYGLPNQFRDRKSDDSMK